ncbi:hypothetical protein K8I61_10540 [bacterium]|nr:hypothetical protein [bacterium]
MSKGVVCIAAYRPREGKENELKMLLGQHLPLLRKEGFATLRPPLYLRSNADGAWMEIFEWVEETSGDKANENPAVKALWNRMAEAAEFIPMNALAEAGMPFPRFEPMHGVVCK